MASKPSLSNAWPPQAMNGAFDLGRQAMLMSGEAARILFDSANQMRSLQLRAAQEFAGHALDAGWGLRYWMDVAGLAAETQSELAACGMRLVDADGLFAGARLVHA